MIEDITFFSCSLPKLLSQSVEQAYYHQSPWRSGYAWGLSSLAPLELATCKKQQWQAKLRKGRVAGRRYWSFLTQGSSMELSPEDMAREVVTRNTVVLLVV